MRRILIAAGVAAATLLLSVSLAPARPASCHYTQAQARSAVKLAEHHGARAIEGLVSHNVACHRGARAASAAPDALSVAIVNAAPTNMGLAKAMGAHLNNVVTSGDPPVGPVIEDATASGDFTANRRPLAHAASCYSSGLSSTDRVYYNGNHLLTVQKLLDGWCWGLGVVISTTNWGHAIWTHTSYCAAALVYAHGPDGTWIGSHSTWAHGFAGGHVGVPGPVYCVAIEGTQYPAVLRVNGNGGWDTYDDYPNPYSP